MKNLNLISKQCKGANHSREALKEENKQKLLV